MTAASPVASQVNLAAQLERVPVTCFWEITSACNLRCIHCEADAGAPSPDELSTEEALALAADLASAGCRNVNLTGGEPLVRRDWPLLARRLAELGLSVTLISNGLLVDERAIERMVEAGVTGASISLDGDREVHDTIRVPVGRPQGSRHDAALRAIELLHRSRLKTAVITQVHQRNLGDLRRMYRQMIELGVDVWQVQLAMPLGRLLRIQYEYLLKPSQIAGLIELLSELIAEDRLAIAVADNIGYYHRLEPTIRGSLTRSASFFMGCMAGCRLVGIGPSGEVKGCPSHPRSFVVGNIRQTPFAEIWADRRRFGYNTEWREELLVGGCARCPYRRVCRAGCTTMAFAVTGTIYDNPFCVQHAQLSAEGK
jgi:radical SAM protein with 4Fe4S-binding SPASM domain